jgi:hypothetical protein
LRLAIAVAAVVLLVGALATGGDMVGGFGRTEAMSLSIDVSRDNLATGVGLGRTGDALTAAGDPGDSYRHAHNLWLTWLTDAGPLALIAWLWIAAWLLWRGYRSAGRGRALAAASLAAVTGFFIFSLFDHPANVERIATAFWFVAALIAAGVRPPERLWPFDRRRVAAGGAAVLALIALTGCGADDEPVAQDPRTSQAPELSTGTDRQPTDGTESEAEPADPSAPEPEPKPPATDETSPEDAPGGAGDEEAIGIDAEFSGRGGKLTPRVVKVPPFIAVTVKLTSTDGRDYQLQIAGQRLTVGAARKTDSVRLAGLHQGGVYRGRLAGGGTVRIEASAEPGP